MFTNKFCYLRTFT